MSFESFKYIFDQIRPSRINLSGLGEPFLNRDIFAMSKYAHMNGTVVNFPTNFTLAEKYMNQIISCGISQLKISIDAAHRDTYLKIRGIDRFEQIIRSLNTLNRIKNEIGLQKPEIRFNFGIQNENIGELTAVINLAHELEVNVVYFQDLIYVGIEDKKSTIVGNLNIETLFEKLTDASKVASEKRIKTNLKIWLKDLEMHSNMMKSVENLQPQRNSRICSFPWFSAFIEVNGDVKPCPHVAFNPGEGIMGNVFEESFKYIWNNDSYKTLRQALREGDRPYVACKACIPQNLFNLTYISNLLLSRS